MAEYKSLFRVGFEVDDATIEEIKSFLYENGVPSISKIGVGFSYLRSLPYCNGNGHALTAKCIKNSMDSIRFSQFDFNHNPDDIIGSVIGCKIFNDTDELVPKTPMRLLGMGVLYRHRLRDHCIEPQDLINYATSFEIGFRDFDFWYKGQIVMREDAPSEWLLKLDDLVQGIPYYWEGERVCLILGGVDDDATVDFNANTLLTVEPGDNESGILVAVARKLNGVFDIEEGGLEMTYTQEQLDEKVALAKKEAEASFSAKAAEYDEKVNELTTKVAEMESKISELETALAAEKERADSAESKVLAMETEKLVNERKSALASKGYPEELIEQKLDFMAKASPEEFDGFVAEFEAIASHFQTTKTATASAAEEVKTVVANLTVGSGSNNEEDFNPIL